MRDHSKSMYLYTDRIDTTQITWERVNECEL